MLALLILKTLRHLLHNQEKQMATPPVTRQQLDDAIDTLVSTVNTGFTDLLAKIAAGQVTTPEDFSAEVAKLQALTATATSDDPGPAAPPVAS